MNKAIVNDATALLEECLCNGDKGLMALYSWFMEERQLIENTVRGLNEVDPLTNSSSRAAGTCASGVFLFHHIPPPV